MLDLERFEPREPVCWACRDEHGGCPECRPDLVCETCGTFGMCAGGDGPCSVVRPPSPMGVLAGLRAALATMRALNLAAGIDSSSTDEDEDEHEAPCIDCGGVSGHCPCSLADATDEVASLSFHVTERRARRIAKLLAADIGLLTAVDCENGCNDHHVDIKLARRILAALAKAGIHPPPPKAKRRAS